MKKKQVDIVTAAQQLFWKHGFKRVSVEEICRTAQVSKRTFYAYYSGKPELAKAVLDRIFDTAIKDTMLRLNQITSSEELFSWLLESKKEGVRHISREFIQDFYGDESSGLKQHVEEKTRMAWETMLHSFQVLQEKGFIRSDLNLRFFLLVAHTFIDLVHDARLLDLFENPEDLIVEMSRLTAFGIAPRI